MLQRPAIEDREFFAVIYGNAWRDFKRLGERLRWRYAFRGQSSSDWGLATHIQRSALRAQVQYANLPEVESRILHDFRRRAHQYVPDPPKQDDLLDWLALIQHHGGPTRLLDFTHSFYAAAFFAMERAEGDAAIWAVDLDSVAVMAAQRASFESVPLDRRRRNELHGAFCASVLDEPVEDAFVLDVEPFRMNPRMAAQQGLFLFPTDLTNAFEENLFATFGVDAESVKGDNQTYMADDDHGWPHVAKIIVPHDLHSTALHDLHTMNVNALSLFGGLDGLARSMDRYTHVFVNQEWPSR